MKQMTKEKQDKQGLPIMLILTLPQPFAWLGKSRAWASKQGYEYSHYMQNVLH